MTKKSFFGFLFFSFISLSVLAQTEPKITLVLLANDKIADVNVDKEKYIQYIGALTDLMKKEFQGVPSDQKIILLFISHKEGKPTIELYSSPKLTNDKEKHALQELHAMSYENTKLVDFPMLIHVNHEKGTTEADFKGLLLPYDKLKIEYENADLKKKYELNKAYAINEVIPVLSAYQMIVEDKFVGVKNIGKLAHKIDFTKPQDAYRLTSANPDYWRAVLEMNLGNQLIPATKIAMHFSQGELDIAMNYLKMVKFFSDPKTTTNDYLKEFAWRIDLFNKTLSTEIEKGIAEHDKGNYEKAIAVYTIILNDYPLSAWAQYELYFSQNALDLKNNKIKTEDRTGWDIAKIKVYKSNPLYGLDVRASNAKEGYLMYRRQEMSSLLKIKEEQLNDIYKYADIAMDLGVYDFAAQLFWYSFAYGKNEPALKKFLYCIEKLGVTNLKENFEGDFKKEFEKIDKEKEKEMKNSSFYKAFKEK
ncbi:MAG: hypothetical protein H7282_05610 [Cytophagaceae bacterium]|nr:hypothetical protein [Cytophagaceae bacterium]